MQQKHFHIPMDQMMSIESKLANKRELEKLAKSFQYDDSKPLPVNLKKLGDILCSYFELSPRVEKALREYIVDKNIPIQVNFKPLKQNQLKSILDEWVTYNSESSTIIEKIYTNNHRNILFKRVLFEQKQTISDYFSTLSDRNMLKAFDLYQLLVDILSRYFLYEYNSDSVPFFEKVNSFNIFIDIVEKFIHSEKRISLGTSKEDNGYIRRIQFERLMQFWEEVNPELTLLSEERINIEEAAVQTTLVNMIDKQNQTDKEIPTLISFLNNSLSILNNLTVNNQNLQELMAIENLYSALRKQKINLISLDRKNFNPAEHKLLSQIDLQSNFSPLTNGDLNDTVQPFQLLKMIDRQDLEQQVIKATSPPKLVKDILAKVYDLYQENSMLTVETLEDCMIDIGIVNKKSSQLMKNLQQMNIVPRKKNITIEQFKKIFNYIMRQDKQLTVEVLEQFYNSRVNKNHLTPATHRNRHVATYRKASQHITHKSRTYIGRYLDSTLKY